MGTRVLSLPLKHFQQNIEDWKMNSYDEAEIAVKFSYKVVRIGIRKFCMVCGPKMKCFQKFPLKYGQYYRVSSATKVDVFITKRMVHTA